MSNSKISDFSAISNLLVLENLGNVRLINCSFGNTSEYAYSTIALKSVGSVYIEDVVLRNYTGHGSSVHPIFLSEQIEESNLYINNFVIENSVMINQRVFCGAQKLSNLTLDTVSIQNTTFEPELELFLFSVKNIQMNNLTLLRVISLNSNEINGSFMAVNALDINNTYLSEIKNVQYINSSINILQINGFENSPPSSKSLKFHEFVFRDINLSSQEPLINLGSFISPYQIDIEFDSMTFSNISYETSGSLIKFDHQLPTNVTLSN